MKKLFLLLVIFFLTTGCNKKIAFLQSCFTNSCCQETEACIEKTMSNLLSNFQTSVVANNGTEELNFTMNLDTFDIPVASISLPILNPKTPTAEPLGTLSLTGPLKNSKTGLSTIKLSLNLPSAIAIENANEPALLPNQQPLSMIHDSIDYTQVTTLKVGTNSNVYFYFNQQTKAAFLGVALTFAILNPIGAILSGESLFESKTINGLALTAGAFFGATALTSGVGVFVDLATVIPTQVTTSVAPQLLSSNLQNTINAPAAKSVMLNLTSTQGNKPISIQ